jgi:hypothetical protein
MNDRCSTVCPFRMALLTFVEFVLVTGSVVGLAFALEQLAEHRANRPITADAEGQFVLKAPQATLHGTLELLPRVLEDQKSDFAYFYGRELAAERESRTIQHWSQRTDTVAWRLQTAVAGAFDIDVECAASATDAGGEFELTLADQRLTATVPDTGGDDVWQTVRVGHVTISQPGIYELTIKPVKLSGDRLMSLKSVRVRPRSSG